MFENAVSHIFRLGSSAFPSVLSAIVYDALVDEIAMEYGRMDADLPADHYFGSHVE